MQAVLKAKPTEGRSVWRIDSIHDGVCQGATGSVCQAMSSPGWAYRLGATSTPVGPRW
jgi:hypothetical protein